MRKMLFLLLLVPAVGFAQPAEFNLSYWKNVPDSLNQPIHMPERDYNPNFHYEYKASSNGRSQVFIVTSDSAYRQLFWRYVYTTDSLKKYKKSGVDDWTYQWMEKHHIDSLPRIDFSKKELLLYAACAQCSAYCNHEQGRTSCHRNACNFRETWFIREKK